MKYLLLAYGDEQKMKALTRAEGDALVARCKRQDEELHRAGKVVEGISLDWPVTTIRPRDGKPVISDGPFVETKEKVGGLVIIEARDWNDAVRIASMHPAARLGEELGMAVEVRPIVECGHPNRDARE